MLKEWKGFLLPVVLLAAGACSGSNDAGPSRTTFVANLTPAQEVPPKSTAASGTATFTVSGNQITMTSLTVQNIDSVTASHIHLGAAGANGGIVVPLLVNTTPSGHITSQALVSNLAISQSTIVPIGTAQAITVDSLLALFNNGAAYVNVHTRANPAGEMRGQILKQ